MPNNIWNLHLLMSHTYNNLTKIRNLSNESKQVREGIVNFFKERDCLTMVRPCDDEKDLQKLNDHNTQNVRDEFMEQVNALRVKIIEKCEPKVLNGTYMTSKMYLEMVKEYIRSINEGGVPVIQNAWENIIESECSRAFLSAKKNYSDFFENCSLKVKKGVLSEILNEELEQNREASLQIYGEMSGAVRTRDEEIYHQYLEDLKEYINQRELQLRELNSRKTSK